MDNTQTPPIVWIQNSNGTGDNNNRLAVAEQISPNCRFVTLRHTLNKDLSSKIFVQFDNGDEIDLADIPQDQLPQCLLIDDDDKNEHIAENIKRHSDWNTLVVGIQKPDINQNNFAKWEAGYQIDLQMLYGHHSSNQAIPAGAAPAIMTDYIPTRINAEQLQQAKQSMPQDLQEFTAGEEPIITVCLGKMLINSVAGQNFSNVQEDNLRMLLKDVRAKAEKIGAKVLITSSPRTGDFADEVIEQEMEGHPYVLHSWQENQAPEENPYLAMLACADHVVVSGDSLSMVADAMATDATVHVHIPATRAINMPTGEGRLEQIETAHENDQPINPSHVNYLQTLYSKGLVSDVSALGEVSKTSPEGGTSIARNIGQTILRVQQSAEFKARMEICRQEDAALQAEIEAEAEADAPPTTPDDDSGSPFGFH